MADPGTDERAQWAWWAGVFDAHRSPAYAVLARGCVGDPAMADAGRPLVVLAAIRRAALRGQASDPWGGDVDAFRADVRRLADEVAEARAGDLVQFTEPLRMADILPGLLLLARADPGRPLRIVDLGSCAGLLLNPHRYEIRYPTGTWSPVTRAATLLSDLHVPADLLDRDLPIEDGIGVDLAPVDATNPSAFDHLRSFSWAGDPAREDRLRGALAAVAGDPVPVLRGDVVDVLPDLLADRVGPDVTTVVIESGLTGHLPSSAVMRVGRILDRFAARGPLALVSRHPQTGPWPSGIGVLHLTSGWRAPYAHTDLLSERTRWVAQMEGSWSGPAGPLRPPGRVTPGQPVRQAVGGRPTVEDTTRRRERSRP